jgi:hypothetical protein
MDAIDVTARDKPVGLQLLLSSPMWLVETERDIVCGPVYTNGSDHRAVVCGIWSFGLGRIDHRAALMPPLAASGGGAYGTKRPEL